MAKGRGKGHNHHQNDHDHGNNHHNHGHNHGHHGGKHDHHGGKHDHHGGKKGDHHKDDGGKGAIVFKDDPNYNYVLGTKGDDVLQGSSEKDVMVGLGGKDTFLMGTGDFAKAGVGADTFVFAADFTGKATISGDMISDDPEEVIFTFGRGDHINISREFGIDNAADLLAHAKDASFGVSIELNHSARIDITADVLRGGTLHSLRVADLQAWTDLFDFV